MTPLRTKMIKAMQVRGFSVRTHESYLRAVTDLARYYHRAPDQLGIEDIRRYFEYLATERSLSGASCRLFLHGIRFLYLQVLDWPAFAVSIPMPKKAQRIPELLTRSEVGRILTACTHPKHRMMLTLCYGCGLRLSELVSLRVRDIDGERQLLRVDQGKGAKDRLVPLSDTLLEQLRAYWRLLCDVVGRVAFATAMILDPVDRSPAPAKFPGIWREVSARPILTIQQFSF